MKKAKNGAISTPQSTTTSNTSNHSTSVFVVALVAIVAVVAIMGFLTQSTNSVTITGRASSVVDPPSPDLTCTETDGGINYYVKGSAKGKYLGTNAYLLVDDYCMNKAKKVTSCSGESCRLGEYYCGDDQYLYKEFTKCACENGACVSCDTFAVTDDSYGDSYPDVYGTMMVWEKANAKGWYDVYLYDATTGKTTQLTFTNSTQERSPAISDQYVVWSGYDGKDTEIYLYALDGGSIRQLTNNDVSDSDPDVYGDYVVWQNNSAQYGKITFMDLGTGETFNMPYSGGSPGSARVSERYVTWEAYQDDEQIFVYDLDSKTLSQISKGNDNYNPDIEGSVVVWSGSSDGDQEIYTYDMSTQTLAAVTADTVNQGGARISTKYISWISQDDVFVYHRASGETTQITQTSGKDYTAAVSDEYVFWQGFTESDTNYEIFGKRLICLE